MTDYGWTYHSGVTGTRSSERIHRSACGKFGRLARTHGDPFGGKGRTRVTYFIWRLPDSAPQYKTMADCEAAAAAMECLPESITPPAAQ